MCILHNDKKIELHVLNLQHNCSLLTIYLKERKHVMIQKYATRYVSFVVLKYIEQYNRNIIHYS